MEIMVRGPLFNGMASAAAHQAVEQIQERVADFALEAVMYNLDGSIKHPTPYYETQINIATKGDARVVNDRGILYGPWLENGASRRVTRFKGYASFRRAYQRTLAESDKIVDRAVRDLISRIG